MTRSIPAVLLSWLLVSGCTLGCTVGGTDPAPPGTDAAEAAAAIARVKSEAEAISGLLEELEALTAAARSDQERSAPLAAVRAKVAEIAARRAALEAALVEAEAALRAE